MIFEYLKRLVKKWFGILSLITTISGFILFYTNFDTRDVIVSFIADKLPYISLVFLFIGTYQVWKDTRLEKIKLEEKLKNPIDYEVKAILKKVKIDLSYIEILIDKNIEETESLIHSAEQELEKLSFNRKEMKIIGGASTINVFENMYKTNLKNYIDELKEYSDKKDDYLLEWKNFSDIELKDIYIVDFYITNIGRQFDEDIDIEIHFNDENKYIGEFFLLDNFPSSNLPSKPKKNKEKGFYLQNILNELDIRDRIRTQANLNPQTHRRFEEIKENIFSVKLRDLKASKTVSIFRNNGYFIRITDKNDIDIIISSKNSTSKINKKLVYEDNGEFDYFQDKKD